MRDGKYFPWLLTRFPPLHFLATPRKYRNPGRSRKKKIKRRAKSGERIRFVYEVF